MWQLMSDICEGWADDPVVRVIIVRGKGNQCFCGDNDNSDFAELRSAPNATDKYTSVTDRFYTLPKAVSEPTITMIAGYYIGDGLDVAQLCDNQVAADRATFGVTSAKLGLGHKLDDVQPMMNYVGAVAAKEIF